MAQIEVECLDSFPNGMRCTEKGQRIYMDPGRAMELAAAGFVRMANEPRNKMLPDSLQEPRPGKAPAAGTVPSSSSSPAAPASPPTMRNKSADGGQRHQVAGRSRST